MVLTNTFFKVRNKNHSKMIQEYLFSKELRWALGGYTYQCLAEGYLCVTSLGHITFVKNRPQHPLATEVFLENLIIPDYEEIWY